MFGINRHSFREVISIMNKPNWANRTMFTGDNLDIMRGMNSESVDLIYLDPPFNSNRNYAAPIGSEAAGAAFKDTVEHWIDVDLGLARRNRRAAPGLIRHHRRSERMPMVKGCNPI